MPQELRERPRSSSQSSSRDVPRQEKLLGRVQPPSNLLTLPCRSRNWFKLCQAIRASAEQIKVMAKDLVARCSIGTGVSNACACGKGPARVFGYRKGFGIWAGRVRWRHEHDQSMPVERVVFDVYAGYLGHPGLVRNVV